MFCCGSKVMGKVRRVGLGKVGGKTKGLVLLSLAGRWLICMYKMYLVYTSSLSGKYSIVLKQEFECQLFICRR